MTALISVRELGIRSDRGGEILRGASLELEPGRVLALVGESGAGKTTLGLALLGYLRPGMQRAAGTAAFRGQSLFDLPGRALRRLRRADISYLPQHPAAALTPTMRVRDLIGERRVDGSDSVEDLIELAGLPADPAFLRRFPHQLSGGQQQRLALARAIANRPELLILDEPSSSLDPPAQLLLLSLVERLRAQHGLAAVLISHDLPAVARVADDLIVLRDGETVERGGALRVLSEPAAPYSRTLVEAAPDLDREPPRAPLEPREDGPLLEVERIDAVHSSGRGRGRRVVHAARDVGFALQPGETLALIGPSGCGKSTIARSITGLHRPSAGRILLDGRELPPGLSGRGPADRAAIQLIPQHPAAAFNPAASIGRSIIRVLRRIHSLPKADAARRLDQLMRQVQLDPALARRRPARLSGGEIQRAAIARALAAGPRVLICDEITSALDPVVQRRIVELLRELQASTGIAIIFISHDLPLAGLIAHRTAVFDQGRLIELAPSAQLAAEPRQARTRALLEAAPPLSRVLAGRRAERRNADGIPDH